MYREKRLKSGFLEWSFWDSWTGMLFGLELGPSWSSESWSIMFGLTLFYKLIFFVEYTHFYAAGGSKRLPWGRGKEESDKHIGCRCCNHEEPNGQSS